MGVSFCRGHGGWTAIGSAHRSVSHVAYSLSEGASPYLSVALPAGSVNVLSRQVQQLLIPASSPATPGCAERDAGVGHGRASRAGVSFAVTAIERKAFTDFVARALRRRHAFVEGEGTGSEAGNFWLHVDFQLKVAQFPASTFAFAARQRDVRMIRTGF